MQSIDAVLVTQTEHFFIHCLSHLPCLPRLPYLPACLPSRSTLIVLPVPSSPHPISTRRIDLPGAWPTATDPATGFGTLVYLVPVLKCSLAFQCLPLPWSRSLTLCLLSGDFVPVCLAVKQQVDSTDKRTLGSWTIKVGIVHYSWEGGQLCFLITVVNVNIGYVVII